MYMYLSNVCMYTKGRTGAMCIFFFCVYSIREEKGRIHLCISESIARGMRSEYLLSVKTPLDKRVLFYSITEGSCIRIYTESIACGMGSEYLYVAFKTSLDVNSWIFFLSLFLFHFADVADFRDICYFCVFYYWVSFPYRKISK